MKKSASADFFINFAAGKISLASANITSPKAKYHSRVARISLRPTGAAPFGRGVKERKPPAKGRFYSFQTVGRGAACLKRKGVSTSAEVDLRLCLKNPQTLKSLIKLLFFFASFCPLSTSRTGVEPNCLTAITFRVFRRAFTRKVSTLLRKIPPKSIKN